MTDYFAKFTQDESRFAIGVYLKTHFSERTLPNLYTNRKLLNGQLICAFAVYYALEAK